jgi:hypothetical protein
MMMWRDLQASVKALHIPWIWSNVLAANQSSRFQRTYLQLLHGRICERQVIHAVQANRSAVTKHDS